MNKKDFLAKAYGAGKVENKNDSTSASADNIKAKDLIQNNPSNSQELDESVSFLKTGGLLKVPVEQTAPDGTDSVYRRVAKFLLLIGEDEAAKILAEHDIFIQIKLSEGDAYDRMFTCDFTYDYVKINGSYRT